MRVRPLTNEEILEIVLEMLVNRFKGRENPAAYRILARNPVLLMKFAEFRDEMMMNGKLDSILKEKIAIKVSTVNECNPCYVSHKMKLEISGRSENAKDEKERAALRFAELAAMNRGKVSDEMFAELFKHFSEEEMLEITLVISLYMFLNTFNSLLVDV
ncbi:MAG: carboxymuconolactone decarboxylase family protein [Archaeoglobus sp.]|uniref:carboxymuconolactone decarboxylase family protein n=1 Tax=Archaeoglobus sp. TaxID=1872626 RepID=UPI001DAE34D1|nr:carboxymuconolactone decarboxylase family protein [Archaeoglobus sp.]MBO8180570.1 carboxymuconolactone decarboxylase family protein [Archaeoglobus sp.]